MTREEAKLFLAEKAKQTFVGWPRIYTSGASKYTYQFYGTEQDCLDLQSGLSGTVMKMNKPCTYYTKIPCWRWELFGTKAEQLSSDMQPLLLYGNYSARERARYCL